MKYSTVILALVAGVFAVPQDATITSAPVIIEAGISPAQSCIGGCQAGDVDCQAACIGSAHPLTQQVLDTNACAAKCDQGDGSKEATQKFSDCQQACIKGYYLTTGLAGNAVSAPVSVPVLVPVSVANSWAIAANSFATSAASKIVSGTNAVASDINAVASGINAVASTASAALASSTPNGASNSHTIQIAGAGLVGLIALFAL